MERHVPGKYREVASSFGRSVVNHWIEPKPFESTTLYEKLGVRVYKKYVPTSGDWVRAHITHQPSSYSSDPEELRKYEIYTRYFEGAHIAMAALLIPSLALLSPDNNLGSKAAILIIYNVLANLYPVMVQRYNRMRFNTVIARLEERQTVLKDTNSQKL